MNWNAFHHRGEILREVIEAADQRLDGTLPLDVPGVQECFADDIDLVGALTLKWHARLTATIERALATQPMDLESAVAGAWRETAEQLPGLRLLIDRATDAPTTPAMAEATQRAQRAERARLAQAAALAFDASEGAVEAGEHIEQQARAGLTTPAARPVAEPVAEPVVETAAEQHDRASFVRRIKAVLAA